MTHEQRIRLSAVEKVNAGDTMREVAKELGVHPTTIGEWVRMYRDGGIDALDAPFKPRPVHVLDVDELLNLARTVPPKYARRVAALIDLAETGRLNETAADYHITPQCLGKWRAWYLAGKWPKN